MKSRKPAFFIGFGIPFFGLVVLFPLYNRIYPVIMGFPFMYFWIFSWLFLTSLCLYIAFKIDPANKIDE
ncbi:DUF3311 domain-containing protein [Clostridium frigoris]|uniref:DUF3311 domain-containing protein n=1 Tax=Clostridium frigoris TaxID=205327 RepID=A0ABS6BYN8_9CLOT|nr:DUF3311 domain-containing protein [Clostridium frigoris]MBU3161691.1 DUF3311 domain-containing protein [Clostridium frigoris]